METSHDGMDRLPENQQSLPKHAGLAMLGNHYLLGLKRRGGKGLLESRKLSKREQGWSQGLREMQPLSSGGQQGGSCGNKHPTLISSKSLIP